MCIPGGKSFLWYQGHLSLSWSNIKVTFFQNMAIVGSFVFHKHILFFFCFFFQINGDDEEDYEDDDIDETSTDSDSDGKGMRYEIHRICYELTVEIKFY